MYLIKVEVKNSEIHGKGVFALKKIPKNTIVWQFMPDHDLTLTPSQFDKLTKDEKAKLKRIAYLSPTSEFWVYPPDNDPARFTSHSSSNNLTSVVDANVSSEPYFITNRDIAAGEELTNNYNQFDQITQRTKPLWAD